MDKRKDERRAKGERSRKAILQAALATLAEEGLEGFTARTVASRAGVSTATVFHHYATLAELQLDAMMQVLDDAIGAQPLQASGDARTYLLSLGDLVMRMLREQPWMVPVWSSLFAKLPFSETLQLQLKSHYERHLSRMELEMAALQGVGHSPIPRRSLALALILLLDGMPNYWMANHDLEYLERFWLDMVALFSSALEPGPAA